MSSDFPKDQEFLLPAKGLFIALSLFVAILLNWLPWSGWGLILKPDFVALVLLYWCTHKPYRVGIGIAWMVGIFADVADASLFGQHALAYAVLAFGGTVLHRRIQMFDLRQQTMQIFPLLLISYAAYAAVHWQVHGFVVWEYFFGCIVSTALWIPLTVLLQTLRRPRSDPNEL
ncbi:MAG: rod shape-determining protein MreD [Gallionellaceae bacterium]|nr:MAG: rod shape-determining protein MreD [Gallionellaceae bacterium]